MFYLESFVNIKDGKKEKIVYVKEDNFVALVRAEAEEAELTGFLYSVLDELREGLSLAEFDELIAKKVHEHNLPPALDLTCGFLENSKLLLKTVGKGRVLGRRGKEGGVIISGNKSAVGKVKVGDLFVFAFEDFEEERLFELKKADFVEEEKEEHSAPFIAAFVERLEKGDKVVSGRALPRVSLPSSSVKFQIALVGFLVLFLLGSVYVGYTRRQEKLAREKVLQVKGEVESLLSKAEEEAILSPSKAKEYFRQAEEKVRELENSLPKGKRALVFEVRELLEQKKASIFKEAKGSLEEFFDLKLLGKEFSGKAVAYSGGKMFVLTDNGKVIEVDLESKSNKELSLEGVGDVLFVSSFNGEVYALSDKGIFKLGGEEKPELLVDKVQDLGSLVDFEVYGKNFYVLEAEKDQVLKFTPVEEGYSEAIEYLKQPLPSVEEDSDMAIDGAIYIASGSRLYRYFQGRREGFSIKLPVEEYYFDYIYTDRDTDNLYLLDKEASKIYVVSKEGGEVQEQVSHPSISKAQGFFVSQGKVYLLIGDKVYLLR